MQRYKQPQQFQRVVRNYDTNPLDYVQNHGRIICEGEILDNINHKHYQPFCECKHIFCPECATNYLIYKILVNQLDIRCLHSECNQRLDEESKAFKKIPHGIKKRYRKLKENDGNSFDSNKCPKCLLSHSGDCYSLRQWWETKNQYFMECPSHFCKRVNEVLEDQDHIICLCGKQICFKCRYTHTQQKKCLSMYFERQQQRRHNRQPQTSRTLQIKNLLRSVYIQQKSKFLMCLSSSFLLPFIIFGFIFILLATFIGTILTLFISPLFYIVDFNNRRTNKQIWLVILTYPISAIILWFVFLPKMAPSIWQYFYNEYYIKIRYMMSTLK